MFIDSRKAEVRCYGGKVNQAEGTAVRDVPSIGRLCSRQLQGTSCAKHQIEVVKGDTNHRHCLVAPPPCIPHRYEKGGKSEPLAVSGPTVHAG